MPDIFKSIDAASVLNLIPEALREQARELLHRAVTSVVDPEIRAAVYEDALELLNNLDSNEVSLDGDCIINDNEDNGYWVTCRVFVYYREEADV